MILVDDDTAVMEPSDFENLLEYSCTLPTGKTIGKRWKCNKSFGTRNPPVWRMAEYADEPDQVTYPNMLRIIWRDLLVIE